MVFHGTRRWLWAAAVLLGVVGSLSIGLFVARSRQDAEVRRLAEETVGSIGDEVLDLYPVREASPDALALEEMAARLGILLAPSSSKRAGRLESMRREFPSSPMRDYIEGVLSLPPANASAPGPVRDWCRASASGLQGIAEFLRGADLHWGQDPLWDMPYEAIHPNFSGVIRLHQAFIACGFFEWVHGDRPWEDDLLVDGGWRLIESLIDRPEAASLLIYTSRARETLAQARYLEAPSHVWRDRASALDLEDRYANQIRLHLLWLQVTRKDSERLSRLREDPNVVMDVGDPWPFGLENAAQAAGLRLAQEAVLLETRILMQSGPCDLHLGSMGNRGGAECRSINPRLESWCEFGYVPPMSSLFARTRDTALHADLTRRVIGLKQDLVSADSLPGNQEEWEVFLARHDPPPGPDCPGRSWVYTFHPSPPRVEIYLSGPPFQTASRWKPGPFRHLVPLEGTPATPGLE